MVQSHNFARGDKIGNVLLCALTFPLIATIELGSLKYQVLSDRIELVYDSSVVVSLSVGNIR